MFECINDAVDCSNDVNNTYAVATGAAGAGWYFSPIGAAIGYTAATINQHLGQSACVRKFNKCIGGC